MSLATRPDWLTHNTPFSTPDLFPTVYSSSLSLHTFSPSWLTSYSSIWAVAVQDHPTSFTQGTTVPPEHPPGNISLFSASHTAGKHPHEMKFSQPWNSQVLLQYTNQSPPAAFYLPVLKQQALLDNHGSATCAPLSFQLFLFWVLYVKLHQTVFYTGPTAVLGGT